MVHDDIKYIPKRFVLFITYTFGLKAASPKNQSFQYMSYN